MPHSDIQSLLDQFRELSTDERGKGSLFERLIANYLVRDPQYSDLLEQVWLWEEWPDRWGADVGIDLVARERATGDYWAIQCKFYDPSHTIQKADIDSFLSASGKQFTPNDGPRHFARRLVVSTTDRWNRHAESAIEGQSIPVSRIGLSDLAESPIDWTEFSLTRPDLIRLRPKKIPLPHQDEAISDVLEGFQASDRGKLIMACGTGKTFTSLKLAEEIASPGGRVLFLAPSISLVAQTLREWTAQATDPIHAFVVCSDTKVGRDAEDLRTHDLAYPATTDAGKLARAAENLEGTRRIVVFSTYQSIQVVGDAQRAGFGDFDLIICDEAHRTTGLTLPGDDPSDFVKVHSNSKVSGAKRLYMTATPRIYADKSKTKADENDAVLYSMDDLETFGPEFHRLGFGKAVDRDLLSEYKVLIVAVEQDKMGDVANRFNQAFKLDDRKAIDINFATKIIGSWKGLSKKGLVLVDEDGEEEALVEDTDPMARAVAFSRSIKSSKQMTETFGRLAELYTESYYGRDDAPEMIECQLQHVDGTMNALQRSSALDWLKDNPGAGRCRILSNARCLSEGIDVPALDAVVFFDTRESIVDIVQSVGRVMRKAEGKRYGYIILPVCMPSKNVPDYNSYIERDPQFQGIWKVIKALRAHDESLVDEAEFRRKIKVISDDSESGGSDDSEGGGDTLPLDFPTLSIDAISEAVYAAIPKKLGDREYWSEWAKSIGLVAERLIARIKAMIDGSPDVATEFGRFVKGLQDTLNPAVTEDEAIEMLAQHILTMPVFQALFSGSDFPEHNAVGKALEAVVRKLDAAAVDTETESLERFYDNVRDRISLAKSDKSKQDIIRNLYDTFFNNAFPRMAERLGIVYTPVQVVDFILNSADAALRRHFGESLASEGVQILDPFAGTGTFLVRLIQSGLIDPDALERKYSAELHANEIVLLAYYIASVNVETAYHSVTGSYQPFGGMILIDTFQMTEDGDLVDRVVLPENNERARRQLDQPIRVIVGNPPYSAQQGSENDNNKNIAYPTLDSRIRNSYAARSSARLVKNLYDSYIRAIRWASDRIGDRGIVAYVTNGSFLDANNMDGLRKCLAEEFSYLYVFNLRGLRGRRTAGEKAKQEGGQIFGQGSGASIAVTVLVKDPDHKGDCRLNYHDIGDYLSREEKLERIESFGSIDGIPWTRLRPNDEGDWVNQRDPAFDAFMPLGDKSNPGAHTIFDTYSQGVLTSRDAWVVNFGKVALEGNIRRMIEAFEVDRERYARVCAGKTKDDRPPVESVIDADPRRISWSRALKADVAKAKPLSMEVASIVPGMYRPFARQWLYFDRRLNEMVYQQPRLFPTPGHRNLVICAAGAGANKDFSAFVTDNVPDYELISKGQGFPLYWYDLPETTAGAAEPDMFSGAAEPDAEGYVRRDAISDRALGAFRRQYGDASITKEDIFWYVYGVLHSPDYKARFASDLKKMIPRIPFVADFAAFRDAGRELGRWHLNYESVEPWPIEEDTKRLVMEADDWRVHKMVFGKRGGEKDRSTIVYNANLVLKGIPEEAYDYVVNGKSAIEWMMERYAVTVHKDSGIRNDPNDWSEDPRYIVDTLKRVIRVSMETVRIVKSLPSLAE